MKKEYIIDANVLFGAFISGKDIYKLLFSKRKIYIPDFAFAEIEKYKTKILKRIKFSEDNFKDLVVEHFDKITVIPNLIISQNSLNKAYQLCKDVDEKDTVYIAAAIEFNCPLITNDKKLYTGLKDQQFENIVLLEDVLKTEDFH